MLEALVPQLLLTSLSMFLNDVSESAQQLWYGPLQHNLFASSGLLQLNL